jgi:hypothetical protein
MKTNLRGFLWSMGRSGTKAILDTINAHTDVEQLNWIDTARFMGAPQYLFSLYPRPFCLTLHLCHHTGLYEQILRQLRTTPVVYAVRDPASHIRSFARVHLNSYISRRIDSVVAWTRSGKTVVSAINPESLAEAHIPTFDHWRHWSAIKQSPHKVVDFEDLKQPRFVQTMNGICDLFGLERTHEIVWPGVANSEHDSFIINYTREFPIIDRKLNLWFTRWENYWNEPGLVSLGTLRSPQLDKIVGPGGQLYVHAKATELLTSGGLEREREAFALFLADATFRENFAAVIAEDFRVVRLMVDRELDAMCKLLTGMYERSCKEGVERFLAEQPQLRASWAGRIEEQAA